jgi:hypothetical protein
MSKQTSVISVVRDEAKQQIVFTVAGAGLTADAPDEHMTLDLALLHRNVISRAVMHGLEQRVRDKGALGFDAITGRYATPREKFLAMKAVVEHLNSGAAEWELRTTQRSESSLLAEAMALAFPQKTAQEIAERIASWSPAEQRKALLLPVIKAQADVIRQRGADPKAAAELLAGF